MGGMTGGKGAPSPPNFAAAAEAQAKSGHINQTNPFGSTSWSQDPKTGAYSQTTGFAPELQQAAGGIMDQMVSQSNAGGAADAVYNQMTSRLDPRFGQQEESLRAQLANQGLDPGSEAYNNAYGNFSRERNDAYQTAANNSVLEGLKASMVPYQQLGALNSLLSTGLSGNGAQTQYLNAANQAYQGAQNQYGAQQAGKNSTLGGIGSLAAFAL